MLGLMLLWVGLLAALIAVCLRDWRYGGALVLGYFLSLSLIHVPGVLPYLASDFLPGSAETQDRVHADDHRHGRLRRRRGRVAGNPEGRAAGGGAAAGGDRQVQRSAAMIFGVFSYFILIPIAARAPSLTSLVSPFGTLLVIGLWLRLYGAAQRGELEKTAQTLLLLPLLPLATLSTAGFIGYGVSWVIAAVAFFFVISRTRLLFYILAPVVVFLGLSFFVAYMGERTGIRDLVWNEQAGIGERFGRISEIFTKFQPLDLKSTEHVKALDDRLNQNLMVGVGVERHEIGQAEFLYGGSVPIWAVVPRALWPDKPDVGGGGEVVENFTGQHFAEGTSVGAGQVLEFYMNFGYPGVIIGFAALGFGLMRLDRAIMDSLRKGDLKVLIRCAMPGLSLLQPGGNLTEIFVVAIGSVVAAYVITSFKVFGVPSPRVAGRVTV